MKKIAIINNPSSGKSNTDSKIDSLILNLLNNGHIIKKVNLNKDDNIGDVIKYFDKNNWEAIILCGGDGTVNASIQTYIKDNIKIPLSVFPTGTVNDFSLYMGYTTEPDDFVELFNNFNIEMIDIGKMNDKFFINVAAGGNFSSVAHKTSKELKNIFGRTAYIMEAIKELTNNHLDTFTIEIECDEINSKLDIMLFIISNSSSIGGFKQMAPRADITDGKLDVVIFKEANLTELVNSFKKLFTGEHINDPNVLYFSSSKIQIKSDKPIEMDIDGEFAGNLPADFSVIKQAIPFITNHN